MDCIGVVGCSLLVAGWVVLLPLHYEGSGNGKDKNKGKGIIGGNGFSGCG
jgi:hypothetical protein